MDEIRRLKGRKTVIMISHRLANVTDSDRIYVMDGGTIPEYGTHRSLLGLGCAYSQLWNAQQSLENYGENYGKETAA